MSFGLYYTHTKTNNIMNSVKKEALLQYYALLLEECLEHNQYHEANEIVLLIEKIGKM